MTQIEREELVERYLAGEMSQIEESDFFLHVAVDNELQRTLRAFRIMDHAIRSDREVVVAERSPYRENIMALLAATPIAGGVGAGMAGSASSAAGTASTGASSVAGSASAAVSSAGVASTAVVGSSAGASAGATGFLGALSVWKIVTMALVGGMLAAGTAMVVSSGSDHEKGNLPAATAPAETQMSPITGSRPIDSLTVDGITGTVDSVPAAKPNVSDGEKSSRELRAPAAPSDVELPRGSRAAKAPALRPKNDGSEQTAGAKDEKYPRKKNPVIVLPNQTNPSAVPVEVGQPKKK